MNKNSLQQVAQLVRERRMLKNYTQQELADLAGISLRSVQRIEAAEVLPRDFTLKALARHLDIALESETLLSSPVKTLNFRQKMIISIGLALVIIILALAFVFQSATFPETAFEICLYVAGLIVLYTLALIRIWKV